LLQNERCTKLIYSFLFCDDTINYALNVKVVTTVRKAVMFYFKELSRHSQGGAEENHTTFSEDACMHYMFNEKKCKAL
jgi:hypothetical protein